ncbi:MAG: hypothetical protein CMP49_03720 [Flavobacteriales bacterium]|jgi:hypothetical protein|nr:hypothetical protein [Flavobacteriales bacterium]|tara:strand:- start:11887 stop:12375 length:489 start_codon:yes stop_codon:yes gene_type:complete
MIQRVQTLYILAGLFLVWIGAFFFPHMSCENADNDIYLVNIDFTSSEIINLILNSSSLVFLLLFSVFSLLAVLKFHNRQSQINYINGNLIAIICLIILIYIHDFSFIKTSDTTLSSESMIDSLCSHNWIFDSILILSCIFFLLAKKYIIKDDKLIKSIDRIR